ncbi:UNKNOWN [Stylonychia lemnae]|uniref:Uncharacterized protein n=1 Tax=Stylonychia lemnae TaxID=5949 RepID=A0A078A4V4_STYLE|nr:UNKNOWN [Stylonychia lemnae]|eukprot:CDW77295.1 UNKNOWN [Stylonychia lemnae]
MDPVIQNVKPMYQKPFPQCPDPYLEIENTSSPTLPFHDPIKFDKDYMQMTIFSQNLTSRGRYVRKFKFYYDSQKKDMIYQLQLVLQISCNSTIFNEKKMKYDYYIGSGSMVIDVLSDAFWGLCRPVFVGKPVGTYLPSFITFDNITNTYLISNNSNYTFFPDVDKLETFRFFKFAIDVDIKDGSGQDYPAFWSLYVYKEDN